MSGIFLKLLEAEMSDVSPNVKKDFSRQKNDPVSLNNPK